MGAQFLEVSMALFAFWCLAAIAVGVWAANRGRSGVGWWLFSMLLSPLLGAIFVAVSPNLAPGKAAPSEQSHVRCPACAEWVLPQAVKCKHCGGELVPQAAPVSTALQGHADNIRLEGRDVVLGLVYFGAAALLVAWVVFRF